jgi:type II secretory pathway component PulJ
MWALVAMLICGFVLGYYVHIFAEVRREQHAQRERAKAERRERMKRAVFLTDAETREWERIQRGWDKEA